MEIGTFVNERMIGKIAQMVKDFPGPQSHLYRGSLRK